MSQAGFFGGVGGRVCLGRRQRHLSQTPTVVCLSAAICFGFRPNPSPILDNDGQERTLWARWQARACYRWGHNLPTGSLPSEEGRDRSEARAVLVLPSTVSDAGQGWRNCVFFNWLKVTYTSLNCSELTVPQLCLSVTLIAILPILPDVNLIPYDEHFHTFNLHVPIASSSSVLPDYLDFFRPGGWGSLLILLIAHLPSTHRLSLPPLNFIQFKSPCSLFPALLLSPANLP